MRRTSWFKPIAVLLAVWLPLIVGEPGLVHACPTHGAPTIVRAQHILGHPGHASPRVRIATIERLGAEPRSPQLHLHQLLYGKRRRAGNRGRRHDDRRCPVRDALAAARRSVAAKSRASVLPPVSDRSSASVARRRNCRAHERRHSLLMERRAGNSGRGPCHGFTTDRTCSRQHSPPHHDEASWATVGATRLGGRARSQSHSSSGYSRSHRRTQRWFPPSRPPGSAVASMPARLRLVFSEPVEPGMAKVSLVVAAVAHEPRRVGRSARRPRDHCRLQAMRRRFRPARFASCGTSSRRTVILWAEALCSSSGRRPRATRYQSPNHQLRPRPPFGVRPSRARHSFRRFCAESALDVCSRCAGCCRSSRCRARILGRAVARSLWLSIATPLFLGLHLLAWMVNASPDHHLDSAWLATSIASTVGRVELLRTGLALLPLWALALARRSGLALALTIPSLLVSAAVGHSAAIHPMWAVPFKAIHLAALAVWIGGLLWIVVRERDDERSATTDIMRVSTLALWAVVIVTLSGIVQTLILVQSLTAIRSPYGMVVVAKVVGRVGSRGVRRVPSPSLASRDRRARKGGSRHVAIVGGARAVGVLRRDSAWRIARVSLAAGER